MKVLPFKIPKTSESSFTIQVEDEPHFYDILHQHPETQITMIVHGHGTLIQGDYVGNFQAGDVFVIGANMPHVFKSDPSYYAKESIERCFGINIFFESKNFGSDFFDLPEMRNTREFISKSVRGLQLTGITKNKVGALIQNIKTQEGIIKMITLLNIFNTLSASNEFTWLSKGAQKGVVNESEGKRLNDIFQHTMKQYHRPITLDEISDVANMTPSAFCRYFKQRTRKTYVSFLNELRVSHACKLLINHDLNVTEVCYRSGFINLSNFNRKFKKITSYTPSQYQKMQSMDLMG